MAIILRFEDEAGTTRLDLNTEVGFKLAEGLDLGGNPVEKVWLKQTPHAGAVLAASRLEIATMFVPLLLLPQANVGAMASLMGSLRAEAERTTNILRFQPDGGSAVVYNTYRFEFPSLFRGQEALLPGSQRLFDPLPIPLVIERDPTPRDGTHI